MNTLFPRSYLVCHANTNFLFSVLQKFYIFFVSASQLNIFFGVLFKQKKNTKGGFVCLLDRPIPRWVHEKRFQYGGCYWTIFPKNNSLFLHKLDKVLIQI